MANSICVVAADVMFDEEMAQLEVARRVIKRQTVERLSAELEEVQARIRPLEAELSYWWDLESQIKDDLAEAQK